jgi:RNA polymerase sigma-70 factor (ECF subfamily)
VTGRKIPPTKVLQPVVTVCDREYKCLEKYTLGATAAPASRAKEGINVHAPATMMRFELLKQAPQPIYSKQSFGTFSACEVNTLLSRAPIALMMPIESTDNELVQLIVGGDREAFAELYRRRQSNVYRFALQMSGARELAEDVTHEVFMVLIRRAANYDERLGSVNGFLLGIARKHLLRRLKKDRPLLPLDEAMETPNAVGQSDEYVRRETIKSVQKAVLSLPEHYREVVVLCELQEMSYAEAAAILECAVGTVRSRLHRARKMLIEKLRPATAESPMNESLKSARCFA